MKIASLTVNMSVHAYIHTVTDSSHKIMNLGLIYKLQYIYQLSVSLTCSKNFHSENIF